MLTISALDTEITVAVLAALFALIAVAVVAFVATIALNSSLIAPSIAVTKHRLPCLSLFPSGFNST